MRSAKIDRKTTETELSLSLTLDGAGRFEGSSTIGFLDHLLDQLARHSLADIALTASGDRHIDDHHLTEDIAIVLGSAFAKAAGDKRGIMRYANCYLPMDDALIGCALDFSGRPYLAFSVDFPAPKIGGFDTELIAEFFRGFAMNAGINLHIWRVNGDNCHHIAEASFKALARCLNAALSIDPRMADRIPSTKGAL